MDKIKLPIDLRIVGILMFILGVFPMVQKTLTQPGVHFQVDLIGIIGIVGGIGILNLKSYGRTCGLIFSFLTLIKLVIFYGLVLWIVPKLFPQMTTTSTAKGIIQSPTITLAFVFISIWQIIILTRPKYKSLFIGEKQYTESDKKTVSGLRIVVIILLTLAVIGAGIPITMYFLLKEGEIATKKFDSLPKSDQIESSTIDEPTNSKQAVPDKTNNEILIPSGVKVKNGSGSIFIDNGGNVGADRVIMILTNQTWILKEKIGKSILFKKELAKGPISNEGVLLNLPSDTFSPKYEAWTVGSVEASIDGRKIK